MADPGVAASQATRHQGGQQPQRLDRDAQQMAPQPHKEPALPTPGYRLPVSRAKPKFCSPEPPSLGALSPKWCLRLLTPVLAPSSVCSLPAPLQSGRQGCVHWAPSALAKAVRGGAGGRAAASRASPDPQALTSCDPAPEVEARLPSSTLAVVWGCSRRSPEVLWGSPPARAVTQVLLPEVSRGHAGTSSRYWSCLSQPPGTVPASTCKTQVMPGTSGLEGEIQHVACAGTLFTGSQMEPVW